MRRDLRPHQVAALESLKLSLKSGHTRPLLQCPTGFGKTVVAGAIVHGALAKGKRVMFVVPALSLINQTVESFYSEGVTDIGVMQGNHPLTNYSRKIQIASVQTLQNRQIPHADIVVIDECHRWFKFYETWMADWDNVPFVGLSATPWTKGLGKFYDDLIIASTTQQLIEQGYLSDFRVFAPSTPDLSKVRTVAGDYHEGDLADAMDTAPITGDIVRTWLAKGERRPTICFAVNRAHAKHIANDFTAAGVKTGYIDAYTKPEERDVIEKKFHTGEIEIVCNVGCLTTGVDWDVRCIILARPTKSEMLFVQMIGRGLRTADGKTDCLVLDHSDTHKRLGFVTDIHHETLDDGKPKKNGTSERKEPLPKQCPSCTFLKPAKVHKCPSCGFAPEKLSDVEIQEGQLEEVRRKKKTNREMTPAEKEQFYSGLLWYANDNGYSKGWASHKYREKTGVWPNSYQNVKPSEPNEDTLNYIRHSQIKWAKSRKSA